MPARASGCSAVRDVARSGSGRLTPDDSRLSSSATVGGVVDADPYVNVGDGVGDEGERTRGESLGESRERPRAAPSGIGIVPRRCFVSGSSYSSCFSQTVSSCSRAEATVSHKHMQTGTQTHNHTNISTCRHRSTVEEHQRTIVCAGINDGRGRLFVIVLTRTKRRQASKQVGGQERKEVRTNRGMKQGRW